MSYPDFLLDKRVVHRNIAKGLVEKKELAKYMKSLPDVEANSQPCTPPEEATPAAAADTSDEE